MSNVPTLQTLVDWANIGVVISLALSFVFGAASVYLGTRLGKLKDAQAEVAQKNLETDLAKQQERAVNAERDLLALQEKVRWRHLTADQRTVLLAALKPNTGNRIRFKSVLGDPESHSFEEEIESVFREAGWVVVESSADFFSPKNPVGIEMRLHDEATAPAYARPLKELLKPIGLVGAAQDPETPQGLATIVVGVKP